MLLIHKVAVVTQFPFQAKWAYPKRHEKVQQKLPGTSLLKIAIKLFESEVITPRPVWLNQFQTVVK